MFPMEFEKNIVWIWHTPHTQTKTLIYVILSLSVKTYVIKKEEKQKKYLKKYNNCGGNLVQNGIFKTNKRKSNLSLRTN